MKGRNGEKAKDGIENQWMIALLKWVGINTLCVDFQHIEVIPQMHWRNDMKNKSQY